MTRALVSCETTRTERATKIFEEIMTKIFPNFRKIVSPQNKHKKKEKSRHIVSNHKVLRSKFDNIHVKFIHGKLEDIAERN